MADLTVRSARRSAASRVPGAGAGAGSTAAVHLAVPRDLAPRPTEAPWRDDHVVLLAHLLGEGSALRARTPGYDSFDEQNLRAVTDAAHSFGILARRASCSAARSTSVRLPAPSGTGRGRRHPVVAWLDGLGLRGLRRRDAFVPADVTRLPSRQVRLFLHHLWSTRGSVSVDGGIGFSSPSRRLCEDVSLLLLRVGIRARLTHVGPAIGRRWLLDVSDVDDQRRFLVEVGAHGAAGRHAQRLLRVLESQASGDEGYAATAVGIDVVAQLVAPAARPA